MSFILAAWFGLIASEAGALTAPAQNGEERQYQSSSQEISEKEPLPETSEDAISALSGSRYPGVIDHLLLRPIGEETQREPQIHINYPSTGQREIDADIRNWVTNLADIFTDHLALYGENQEESSPDVNLDIFLQDDDLNLPRDESDAAFELWGDYKISCPSKNGLSVTFEIWNYTGKDQNNLDILTLNYNTLNGQRLHFVDIFEDPELALSLMSEFSRRQLEPRLGASLRSRMLRDGTEPLSENFSSLTLTPDGVCINFQPWQVAPWEAGIQKVNMPLDELLAAGPLLSLWNK